MAIIRGAAPADQLGDRYKPDGESLVVGTLMNLVTIWEEIRGTHRGVTEQDIRETFGDYHNMLRWLAGFLSADEKLADSCIIDACTIAETTSPAFRQWLIRWAARATVECARNEQHIMVVELASKYEKKELAHSNLTPLSKPEFLFLVKNSEDFRSRLDPLCRFVLVLCGIANISYEEVADQLGVSQNTVEGAYSSVFELVQTIAGAQQHTQGRTDLAIRPLLRYVR